MTYSSKDIQIKTDIEHVRSRPKRYLGDYAHTTAAREIIDNACDEVTRGYGTTVQLTFHDDGSIEVQDDGRGIPIDFDAEAGMNGIEKCLANLRSGSNFGSSVATAGTNGEGATITNAISRRFDVTVYRDGKKYVQQFCCGIAGEWEEGPFNPEANFTPKPGTPITPTPAAKTDSKRGTVIRFIFDDTLPIEDELNVDEIIDRLGYTARLTKGMRTSITRNGETERFEGPDYGAAAVLEKATGTTPVILMESDTSYTITAGKNRINKTAGFDLAVTPSSEPTVLSFVNTVMTADGGSHVSAALAALGQVAADKKVRGLKLERGEAYPTAEDFAQTISVAINARVAEASLSGQHKSKLDSRALHNAFKKEITRLATAWVVTPANADQLAAWAELALIHARTTRKIESARASAAKQSKRRNNNGTLSLPDKYVPCRNTGRGSNAEIHICEGDSAANTVRNSRDSDFQACFPLRGKQMNSYHVPLGKEVDANATHNPRKNKETITMRHNESFVALERILGAGVREHCDPEKCRFDRIIFSTDADADGANISAQLMCMFYFNFRPLLEAGMVYVAVPPLFVITSSKEDGKRHYAMNRQEMQDKVAELKRAHRNASIEVKRCKGLGEMNPDEFSETVMNPETRTLRQITVDDMTEHALYVAFGSDAELRRQLMNTRSLSAIPSTKK